MPDKPRVDQGGQAGNELYAGQAFPNYFPASWAASPFVSAGDTGLFAGVEPVIDTIANPHAGAAIAYKTASGATPLLISDAIKNQIYYLETNIKPVQDLHGYANPWPAGGGKNKFNFTDYSDWFDGYLKPDGDTSGFVPVAPAYERCSPYIAIDGGQTYTASYVFNGTLPSGGMASNNICFYDSNMELVGTRTQNQSVTWISATAPSNAAYLRFSLRTYNMAEKYQVEAGSTATTFAPYSNLCPIVGWQGAEVTVSGKNLCDPNEVTRLSANVKAYVANGYQLKGGFTYTFSVSTKAAGMYIVNHSTSENLAVKYNSTYVTYTPTEDVHVILDAFYSPAPSGGTQDITCQLEFGSSATSYTPYRAPSTSSVTFGDNILGGTAEIVAGTGSKQYESVTWDGSIDEDIALWSSQNPNVVRLNYSGMKRPANNQTAANIPKNSLGLSVRSASDIANQVNTYGVGIPSNINTFILKIQGVSTVAGYRAFLEENPLQIIFEKDTPTPYTFPAVNMFTRDGTNYIWTNCGDNVSVNYAAVK